jgi:hypothetical protein
VFEIWENTAPDKLTQAVFCDFSTPNKNGKFNVHDDMKEKLIKMGIPEHEIAVIHDAKNDNDKKELFAKVRQGKVRVLFGSTFKMGAGTNVQDKLVAIHDTDCPWHPSDFQQRFGRISRQGNKNKNVTVYRFVRDGTFDSYLYQGLENKQRFISQVMTGKTPFRSCDDVDEMVLNFAEVKALCAGNPLIKEKIDLDIEVAKLKMLKSEHQNQQYKLEDSVYVHFPNSIKNCEISIENFEKDKAKIKANTPANPDEFPAMIVKDVKYTDKQAAGEALLNAVKGAGRADGLKIGEYRGLAMSVSFSTFDSQYYVKLKGKMSYECPLGSDVFGNITRMNNALADVETRVQSTKMNLENYKQQLIEGQAALNAPFPREAELSEKEAKLVLINAELNIENQADTTPIEASADLNVVSYGAADMPPNCEVAARSKPSVLDEIKEKQRQFYDTPRMPPITNARFDRTEI